MIRAYAKYLRQIGFAFSQQYIEDTLARHPQLAGRLVELFDGALRPGRERSAGEPGRRPDRCCVTQIVSALDAIPSLDEDRICRMLPHAHRGNDADELLPSGDDARLQVRPGGDPRAAAAAPGVRDLGVQPTGRRRPSARRPDRPRRAALERPPRGLPDRGARADEGADGQERRDRADRSQRRVRRQASAERPRRGASRGRRVLPHVRRRHCSTSPTTSSAAPSSTHPTPSSTTATTPTSSSPPTRARPRSATSPTPCRSSTASGSATRSPRVAAVGYDHKAMGITARGAWESVRRHARSLGRDADTDPLTVVGIGDMSGDVFGNGMLRSHGDAARRRLRPPPRLHRSRPRPAGGVRRTGATVRPAAVVVGRLRPRADLDRRRRVPADAEVDRPQRPRPAAALGIATHGTADS